MFVNSSDDIHIHQGCFYQTSVSIIIVTTNSNWPLTIYQALQ